MASMITTTAMALVAVALLIAILLFALNARRYHKTPYARATGNGYFNVMFDKGRLGEFALGEQIWTFDPEGKAYFNVYIPKSDGTTSEVDAVYVAPWGIVVFENKNYSGWIFGRAGDPRWTQTLNRHTKNSFMNPIRQNDAHVKALASHLSRPVGDFFPMVVFADKTVFKSLDADGHDVIHTAQVPDALGRARERSDVSISGEEMACILESISACTRADKETKRRHIENIRAKGCRGKQIAVISPTRPNATAATGASTVADASAVAGASAAPGAGTATAGGETADGGPVDGRPIDGAPGTCPRCGAPLVLRVAKRGKRAGMEFYGCSTFPKCRYMKDIQK